MTADRFSGRLKELREQAGLSQKGLAERAGLAQSAIGHLEQGLRRPTWETVLALANVLGVSCEAFTEQPAERPPAAPGRPRNTAVDGKAAHGSAATPAKRKGQKRGRKSEKQ
jgi:transcriptional regulator with XRE-family HTH domain